MGNATGFYSSAQCPVPKRLIDIKPSLKKIYNVSEGDNSTFVTGCDLLPNGEFVIADGYVPYVKYYDNQGSLKKQINTAPCKPFDVCFIDNSTIAVSTTRSSLNNENILIVNTTDNKLIRKIHLGKGYKKLYFDSVLIVGKDSVDDSEIILIKSNGQIINILKTKAIGGVFALKKMIYYTEWTEGVVICCDEYGHIKWRYKDPKIKYPYGIVVDDRGFVFVACHDSCSVVAISADRQTSRVIIKDNGLNQPFSLAIDHENSKVIVCNKEGKNAFLYQL